MSREGTHRGRAQRWLSSTGREWSYSTRRRVHRKIEELLLPSLWSEGSSRNLHDFLSRSIQNSIRSRKVSTCDSMISTFFKSAVSLNFPLAVRYSTILSACVGVSLSAAANSFAVA
jgi:hypothetical protein